MLAQSERSGVTKVHKGKVPAARNTNLQPERKPTDKAADGNPEPRSEHPTHDPYRYGNRPFAFICRYVGLRPTAHVVVIAAVLAAVACSVATQYGVKHLVDVLSGASAATGVWYAFLFL